MLVSDGESNGASRGRGPNRIEWPHINYSHSLGCGRIFEWARVAKGSHGSL